MKRSTWIAAVVMTLAIAGAIAWAGIDAERTEERESAARDEGVVVPGTVVADTVVAEADEAVAREAEARPAREAPFAPEPEVIRTAVASAQAIADEEVTRRLAALEDEPRDEAWASEQERALRAWGDGRAAEQDARLADVRCRTSTCTVELVWPTYADAQREAREVLAGAYGRGCERELRTPMPQDPRLPYAAFLLLTCTR